MNHLTHGVPSFAQRAILVVIPAKVGSQARDRVPAFARVTDWERAANALAYAA